MRTQKPSRGAAARSGPPLGPELRLAGVSGRHARLKHDAATSNALHQAILRFRAAHPGPTVAAVSTAVRLDRPDTHNVIAAEIRGHLWSQPVPLETCCCTQPTSRPARSRRATRRRAREGAPDGRADAMDARLLRLLQRRAAHLRELGGEFAREFPKIAARLGVEGLEVTDPYVERLLEGCAFLAARVQLKHDAEQHRDARVNVEAIFADLRRPPYGVRDGILPVLLAVFAVVHDRDLAFYKDGTFLRGLTGEEMLLLTKDPTRFEVQFCKIQGIRAEVFQRLVGLLEISASAGREIELLEVVKRLCVFVAELPPYVRNTKRLSSTALMVRDAILEAREPATLIFADLPQACGFKPITNRSAGRRGVSLFIETLRSALDELRVAYSQLEERLRKQLRIAFELPGSFDTFRQHLSERAGHVVLNVREPKLRAFCLRLADGVLSEPEWLESLGSYLALRPPGKWQDSDEDLFDSALLESAAKFHRVESIVFSSGRKRDDLAIRLAVTLPDGHEHERVVHISRDEKERLTRLQREFEGVFAGDPRLGLAAASRAIWNTLEKTRSDEHGH